MNQHNKSLIDRSKVISIDKKLDQKIDQLNYIIRSVGVNEDQPIKSGIFALTFISNVCSANQKFDQQIKDYANNNYYYLDTTIKYIPP